MSKCSIPASVGRCFVARWWDGWRFRSRTVLTSSPINYVVDHGTVVFRTAEGTKLAGAVLGTGVAFEVDGLDTVAKEAWSVVVKGRATEIHAMHELFDAADLPLFPWLAGPKHRFVRIHPDEVTGRRFRVVDEPAETRAATRASDE